MSMIIKKSIQRTIEALLVVSKGTHRLSVERRMMVIARPHVS